MSALDPNDIAHLDIAVNPAICFTSVSKAFRQRQRSGRFGEALRALVKPEFRHVQALDKLSFEVATGEIVAYAGANGAGKSTTIKLCSGMLGPDTGTVRVLGMDPVAERVNCVRRIGVVFGQRSELWMDHPVAASFEWKRVVWDIPQPRFDRMLGYVRETLGLDEFFRSTTRELSLGQRMRADLGLALMHEPELLFLDEPTLGLDVLAKRHALAFVRRLNQEHGVTVVVTSHDMADLEQLAARIIMIHNGQIAFDGSFDKLRRQHADKRKLTIETGQGFAPQLLGAVLVESQEGRHTYSYDASMVGVADLLREASEKCELRDVETHRADIDEVIADIYESWQGKQPGIERP